MASKNSKTTDKTAKKPAAKKAAPKTKTKTKTATARKQNAARKPATAQNHPFTVLQGGPTTENMEKVMTKSKAQFEKLSNDAAAVGKENMDAWMKSGTIFMKGYEDIVKTCMNLAQKNAEKNGEVFKALLACKTANEYAELQTRLAQQGFDDFMQGATQLSEMSVKLASESLAPINDQLGKSIKKASDALAA